MCSMILFHSEHRKKGGKRCQIEANVTLLMPVHCIVGHIISCVVICCILHMLAKEGYVVTACRKCAAHRAEAVHDSAGAPVLSAQSGSCSSLLASQ